MNRKADPASSVGRFRGRFPELVKAMGFYEPGPQNAITDVLGVEVGHSTLHDEARGLHSGVTAIWPRRDVYRFRPWASGHVLHGAGEMTGLTQALEWGLVETPILLTSTLNVGRVHDAVVEYLAEQHPDMGKSEDVVIPVVAECDDGFLSRARERPVGGREVREALDDARGGPVAEGAVGAGAGMIAFDFQAGIGTASRVARLGPPQSGADSAAYTVGALVNANFGVRRQLRAAGRALGRELEHERLSEPRRSRSAIVVLATDAPLRPDQLRRLAVRAGMGLARVGSYGGHYSGELVLSFTTALGEPRGAEHPAFECEGLRDVFLNPLYEATVECVEESVLNALAAGREIAGRDGHRAFAL